MCPDFHAMCRPVDTCLSFQLVGMPRACMCLSKGLLAACLFNDSDPCLVQSLTHTHTHAQTKAEMYSIILQCVKYFAC